MIGLAQQQERAQPSRRARRHTSLAARTKSYYISTICHSILTCIGNVKV
jgi:hypothetical protein